MVLLSLNCLRMFVLLFLELTDEDERRLLWILGTPFEEEQIGKVSAFQDKAVDKQLLVEIGPR